MATNKLLLLYESQEIVSRLSAQRDAMTEEEKEMLNEAKTLLKKLMSMPRMLHFF